MTPRPYLVLGKYKPGYGNYFGSIIGPEILERLADYSLIPLKDGVIHAQTTSIWVDEPLHAEVRRFVQTDGQGAAWHQDGDLDPGCQMDHAAVLWANKCPTQFRTIDGTIWQPKPFEIVIARNLACFHRTPPDAPKKPNRRWLFRQRVELPTTLVLP